MAKKVINSINVTKLDIINAESSESFKKAIGTSIPVGGVAIIEDADRETGEPRNYAYIFAKDGNVYGGNSATISRGCEMLIEVMSDEPTKDYSVNVVSAPTASGREFLSLRVLAE